MTSDQLPRTHLPIPDPQHVGVTTYDAKDPGHGLPADHAASARRPARRTSSSSSSTTAGFGAVERLRRSVRHADLRAARGRRPQVHPLPHHRAVLADPRGAADRPQPPQRRHGRHHRDRHVGAGLQLGAAQGQGAARRDAQAQRLRHGPVRQVPRGAGLGDQPDGPVRRLAHRAAASSTSTASSAARPTSTPRRSTGTPCRSSPTGPRRRATTSPRT